MAAVDRQGNPAGDYTVEPGSEVEGCSAAVAAVDADVVSCSPSAAAADVCRVLPDRVGLLGGTEPWEKSLRRMTSTEPVDPAGADPRPLPWGVELADGSKCRLRNGGSWPGRADALAGAYHCQGPSKFVLAAEGKATVNQSADAWTVLVGDLGADNGEFPPPTALRVVTAYFAGYA